jgi:hypothetical protein
MVRLTSEKAVVMGDTEVSFVIPSASLEVLDSKKNRQDEQEKREEGFYMRNLVLFRLLFGIMDGSWQQDKASIAYIMEEGKHYIIATFDKRFEKDPSKVRTPGVREIEFDHFPALLKKLGGGEIHSVNFVLDTFGMPTTVFAIPLDSKGQPLGVGPWGQMVAGVCFSPSPRKLIARPVVIPANGMSREDSRDELADALGE